MCCLAESFLQAQANRLRHQPGDIPHVIELAKGIEGLSGVIIIQDDKMGLWGEIKICQISELGHDSFLPV